MALIGTNDEQKIWNYLISAIGNEIGVAGLMGNLWAESGLRSNNLQNTFEKKLNMTDDQYTQAIDNGSYPMDSFIHDKAGYGLAQWTFWNRKQNMYNYIKNKNKSISDLESQLEFLMQELNSNYPTVLVGLKNSQTIQQASNIVLLQFEKPKIQDLSVQEKRAKFGLDIYNRQKKMQNTISTQLTSSNNNYNKNFEILQACSTHNTTIKRNRNIDWIVIHYTAGTSSANGSAKGIANFFATATNQASADFIVDDNTIVQYNPDPKNHYCWAVGGTKYATHSTSLSGKFYNQCRNNNSIHIEMCSRKTNQKSLNVTDNDWYFTNETIENTIKLVKYLMKEYNININHVIMHHMVTGKLCPQPWVKNQTALNGWYNFLNKIQPGAGNSTPNLELKYPYQVEITANILNIRKGPDTSYAIIGKAKKGEIYTIIEEQNNWIKLQNNAGWINAQYVQKI